MCGIYASFDRNIFDELKTANEPRGDKSRQYEFAIGGYNIGHIQAPTTQSDICHPAVINKSLLWHNGIIKQSYIPELQQNVGSDEKWDTFLLLRYIEQNKDLSEIDGTFACLYFNGTDIMIFRNALAPMFIGDHASISSVKTKYTPIKIDSGEIYKLNTQMLEYEKIGKTFTTKNNPYYMVV